MTGRGISPLGCLRGHLSIRPPRLRHSGCTAAGLPGHGQLARRASTRRASTGAVAGTREGGGQRRAGGGDEVAQDLVGVFPTRDGWGRLGAGGWDEGADHSLGGWLGRGGIGRADSRRVGVGVCGPAPGALGADRLELRRRLRQRPEPGRPRRGLRARLPAAREPRGPGIRGGGPGAGAEQLRAGPRFSVSDDGTGYDTRHTPMGSGLRNMADRLAALGGRLDIQSAPGQGTTITAELPVPDGDHQAGDH